MVEGNTASISFAVNGRVFSRYCRLDQQPILQCMCINIGVSRNLNPNLNCDPNYTTLCYHVSVYLTIDSLTV